MDKDEKRARHAAYMRSYYADPNHPERIAKRNANSREWYRRDRDRILERRRQQSGAGPRRRQWTDAEILDEIRAIAVDGIATYPRDGRSPIGGGALGGVAADRFGSWRAACHAAGVISGWERPLAPNAKYSTVHSRLLRERGSPQHCERCGAAGSGRRYEWALRVGVITPLRNPHGSPYSIRLDEYQRLCKACHVVQDDEVRVFYQMLESNE